MSEILVIVVGIMIALAGEQTLEWFHWQHEVAEARVALREEIDNNLHILNFIIAEEPCIGRRLAEAGSALGVPGALPLKRPLGQPQLPTMSSAAWDGVRASGALDDRRRESGRTHHKT